MANSLKNITVPLTSNLNMNRNKSLTCSSYDILNGINAPVFGGSISPLHYKIDFQGDAKYSVDGERWTMDSNKLYRGGLLFKDFTGEYTFDMHDTGLDMDAMVLFENYFLGVKVANGRIEWNKINNDFQIVSSGTILTIDNKYQSLAGLKLCVRNNVVFLLIGEETVDAVTTNPERVLLFTWMQGSSSFTQKADIWFAFRATKNNDEWTRLEYVRSNESTVKWFFSVSQLFTENQLIGITIFRQRPNGTNSYKNVKFCNFFMNNQGDYMREISLRSGMDVSLKVSVDNSSFDSKTSRTIQAYFVDNTKVTMAISTDPETRHENYQKMMSITNGFTQSGTDMGIERWYTTTPSGNERKFDATLRFAGESSSGFAEIKKLGSCALTVNFNGYGRLVIAGFGQTGSDSNGQLNIPCVNYLYDAQNIEYDRMYGSVALKYAKTVFNAGCTSNASIPTTADAWDAWWNAKDTADNTCWNPAGMRAQISGTNFYTLFNGKEGNAAGISYATSKGHIGTLLTEWGSIVQTFENCATVDKVIFKDAKTNTVKYIQRRSNITLDDVEVVGKYVLVRCTADENIYDISSGKWAKFSNDWNNRLFFGYENFTPRLVDGVPNSNHEVYFQYQNAVKTYNSSWATSGSVAAGYDVAFQKEKGFAPSRLYNYTSLSGIVLGEVNAFGYELTSENGLDVFASSGTSAPAYKTTLFGNGASSSVSNLAGGVYPITSSGSAYFNIPIIESTVVDSYNGKYGLKIDGSVYTIAYDGIRPIALYNTSSIVDQVDDFFIVQSQYYALINGYICSLSYSSSNVISGVEQIVNVQGMKFIGAFPSCAYFYSPSARAIFAFTGDADLQLFVQTDRITEVYNSKYYPNCEWIFMSTSDGLYVMTQNNTFKIDAMNVKRFFPTDDEYCVLVLDNETKDNIFISMNRYSGWETMPVVLETSFFGEGDMKKSTITDWYIRVFKGDEDYNGTVKCSAKTITDIVSQAVKTFDGVKEEKLTKDKFDSNDNAMITFHTGCCALGTSCKVVSDYPICYFGFSIGSDGSTNKSKLNI